MPTPPIFALRARQLIAAGAAALAVAVTAQVPWLAERTTFLLPLLVIVLICWTSGWRTGAIAAVAGLALVAVLMPPPGGWLGASKGTFLRLVTFTVATAAVLIFARAREEAEARMARGVAAANRQKEQFVVLLAHELRTPLNAAMGWFHIMRTGSPEDAAEKAADAVDRNLRMMHALIEDIVDFNRSEFGKLTLNRQQLDPAALLQEVVTSVRSIADARGIRLETAIAGELPQVEADPKRLRQIVLNLLNNALKFTPRGGSVVVAANAQHSGYLAVSITDTGQGIAPEHLERIFEPLWQPAGSERGDGLGLGLALVKRLVEAHGGTVQVKSDGVGLGVAVTVRLPARAA